MEKLFEKSFKKSFKSHLENCLESHSENHGIIFDMDCELKESENHHSRSFKKLGGGNGEAICCFGEAIAYLHYSVSSAPFISEF